MPFIQDMAEAYATADLVVSRSGSGILAEIKALNVPSILIPSPNVAEDHQTRNAESLSKIGAAILLPEREINQSFERVVIKTISDAKKLESLRSTLKSLPHLESDKLIVDQVVKLFNKTSNN
jgi:UDP-N-acetylglucosamine--N-acetylmuramyl-(pentapeptide) pyrophosphoryl-undecaprenol N-acetylglucosamine transferase